jgi:hypothetical protein
MAPACYHRRSGEFVRREHLIPRLALAIALVVAPLRTEAASTARAAAVNGNSRHSLGTAFFVRAPGEVGTAAVTTAHSLPLATLVSSERLEFELGAASANAVSRALLAAPGRAYHDAGDLFSGDFHLFALSAPPHGVEPLELAASAPLNSGLRVEILGPPDAVGSAPRLEGRIQSASASRIEIEVTRPPSAFEGWGGAPVLRAGTREAIGMLQALRARSAGSLLVAAPLSRVAEALNRPLASGRGEPFSAFTALLPPPAPERTRSTRRAARAGIALSLAYPPDGSVVSDSGCGAFVAGRVEAAELRRIDVIFALDVSSSTRQASGADIDGDGLVGVSSTGPMSALASESHSDPGDSVAAAEIAAARVLVRRLDLRAVRVGLVAFSGFDTSGSGAEIWESLRGSVGAARLHAETLAPLTRDASALERALERLLARTPHGHTHIAAGLDQSIAELAGVRGARSQPDPESRKIVFLFTDGAPTLPYPGHAAANTRVALEAADRARKAGVEIHTFAIGGEALNAPVVSVELAARTGGVFTPVRNPGDLALAVGIADLPQLASLELASADERGNVRSANLLNLAPDGSWAGFVPLAPSGEHSLRIRAFGRDGSESSEIRRVVAGAAAAAAPIPAELAERRNELLEECLLRLRAEAADAERARSDEIRERLRQEILRERENARKRADEQRRQLELEVEPRPPSGAN